MRDVSEVRRRDRLLLSKDATIREIHHRVKNNLQTISSLLRLQGRRLDAREAKLGHRGVGATHPSIALVHETLSRRPARTSPSWRSSRARRMVEEACRRRTAR